MSPVVVENRTVAKVSEARRSLSSFPSSGLHLFPTLTDFLELFEVYLLSADAVIVVGMGGFCCLKILSDIIKGTRKMRNSANMLRRVLHALQGMELKRSAFHVPSLHLRHQDTIMLTLEASEQVLQDWSIQNKFY